MTEHLTPPPAPQNGHSGNLSYIALYVFDDNRRMYGGGYTLRDTEFRKGRDDCFFCAEDRAFIAKLIREKEPDKPWKPFYPEHAYKGKLWVKSVFEMVWVPSIESGIEAKNSDKSIRWTFDAMDEIRVYERAIDHQN